MKQGIAILVLLFSVQKVTHANDLNELIDFDKIGAKLDNATVISPSTEQESLFNGIELTAGSDKKNASFKWAPKNGSSGFAITATVPLESDSSFTDFYDTETDVFANASTVTATYRKSFIPELNLKAAGRLLRLCTLNPEAFGFKTSEKNKCATEGDLANLVTALKPEKATEELTQAVSAFVEQQKVPIIFWGTSASYGRNTFDFFSDTTLNKASETKNPYGFSVFRSFLKPDDYMFTVALEYQKGYKAMDPVTRCPVTSDSDFVDCISAAGGAPKKETNKNLKLSYRTKIKDFSFPVALSLEIAYDMEDDGTTVSLPVYVFGDGKGGLNGGIRYDYESGDTGSSFSIFVGSRFSLSN